MQNIANTNKHYVVLFIDNGKRNKQTEQTKVKNKRSATPLYGNQRTTNASD